MQTWRKDFLLRGKIRLHQGHQGEIGSYQKDVPEIPPEDWKGCLRTGTDNICSQGLWCKLEKFKVAVINRRTVDSYKKYQDECIQLAADINKEFRCEEVPEWKPIDFQTDGVQRQQLVAFYKAMDVGNTSPTKVLPCLLKNLC